MAGRRAEDVARTKQYAYKDVRGEGARGLGGGIAAPACALGAPWVLGTLAGGLCEGWGWQR